MEVLFRKSVLCKYFKTALNLTATLCGSGTKSSAQDGTFIAFSTFSATFVLFFNPPPPFCAPHELRPPPPPVVLACPLLEVPVIVFHADVDALGEVAAVRNGSEEVVLDQRDVEQLRGAGRAGFRTARVQEDLRNEHGTELQVNRTSTIAQPIGLMGLCD